MKCIIGRIVCALTALGLTLSAQAKEPTVSEPKSAGTKKAEMETLNYWSRELIAAATALVMADDRPEKPSAVEPDTGTPESTPGGEANPDSESIHRLFYPDDWSAVPKMDGGALYAEGLSLNSVATASGVPAMGSPGVYTYYPVNEKSQLWTLYPHRWMGKFTFSTPQGNGSCTATAISNNHIVTAAHCVYDTWNNTWHSNKAFTPAYRNGSTPYGIFATTGCTILAAWANLSGSFSINNWSRYDVAVCNAGTNSAGQTLNQAVGWAGRSWNHPYNQVHFNGGYAALDYNDIWLPNPAQYLLSCTAESFQQATDVLGMGCQYGRGVSGGSWLKDYKANYPSGYVNAVNSGLYIGAPNLYGPRFSSGNIVLICNATGC